jgi:phosphoribosyl-AMP cyclohydrolase
MDNAELINKLKFNEQGLIPAIIQDNKNGEVLMLAYMNKESLKQSLETKKATFWSRSRGKLWIKGETSGNFQYIKKIFVDCDVDSLLIKVEQVGVACHTGNRSCFYRSIKEITE